MTRTFALAHGEPDQQTQNQIQRQSHPELPVQSEPRTVKSLRPPLLTASNLCGPFAHSAHPAAAHFPFQPLKSWCTGEDSNLRSSKERQIYSLLPLTARPPVPITPNRRRPVRRGPEKPHRSPAQTPHPPQPPLPHFSASSPVRKPPAFRSMHLCGITAEDRPGASKKTPPVKLLTVSGPVSRFH
jgi:hypothetical protein